MIFATIPDVDKSTLQNIQHVAEYTAEITRHMQAEQNQTMPNPFYIRTL